MEKLAAEFPGNETLHSILYPRVSDLMLFQNVKYARRYLDFVKKPYQDEIRKIPGDDTLFTETVARWLF